MQVTAVLARSHVSVHPQLAGQSGSQSRDAPLRERRFLYLQMVRHFKSRMYAAFVRTL